MAEKKNSKTSGADAPEVLSNIPTTLEEALAIIEAQKVTIDELSKSLSKAEATAEKAKAVLAPTVEIDGDTYVVNMGVFHNQKNISAKELAEDVNFCKELLAIDGQTFLTKEEA